MGEERDVGGIDDDETVVVDCRHLEALVHLGEPVEVGVREAIDHFVVDPLVIEHELYLPRKRAERVSEKREHVR